MRVTSSSPTSTVRMSWGDQGVLRYDDYWVIIFSHPRKICIQHYIATEVFLVPLTKAKRALSCLQVYLPCCNASGHLERMWWMVGCLWPQRRQLGSVFSFQHLRLWSREGVSAISKENDNWPAGGLAGFSSTPGWNLPVLQLPGSCFGQLVPSVSCRYLRQVDPSPLWRWLWQDTTPQIPQSLVYPREHRCTNWSWASQVGCLAFFVRIHRCSETRLVG